MHDTLKGEKLCLLKKKQLSTVFSTHPLFQSSQLILGRNTANHQQLPAANATGVIFKIKLCLHLVEENSHHKSPITARVQPCLSLGFSTYFLNCLTLLRVCSANSLDGSKIRALGPLDVDWTWLTLGAPAPTQTIERVPTMS